MAPSPGKKVSGSSPGTTEVSGRFPEQTEAQRVDWTEAGSLILLIA